MAADDTSGPAEPAPGEPAPGEHPAPSDHLSDVGVSRVGDGTERYGPLAIARYLKDDGRALLLYRHAAADLD